MIPEPPPATVRDRRGQAVRTLRERLAALGVATWRCDNAGLVLCEPDEPGPVGLLLRSGAVTRLVSRTAADWAHQEAPAVTEVFEGAWAVPLPEQRRRARTGVTLGLALSEPALAGPFLRDACAAAALDPAAVRRLLAPRARYSRPSAESLQGLVLWMAQDLARVEESDQTVAGFTRQLSDCFETIDVLYALGRSMNDLAAPAQFIENMCRRVRAALSFGFVAGWFGGRERPGDELGGRLLVSGDTALRPALERALPRLLERTPPDARALILADLDGEPVPGSGQILAHPVVRAGHAVGFVLAGDKFGDDPQVSSYDIQLLEAAAGYVGSFVDNIALYAEQKALSIGTLEALTAAIDAKDRYTCGHSQRVAHLSWLLASASGMPPERAERVRIAGLVHDVGKIGVPESVLTKAGRLTDDEFDAIKRHPEIGHRILKDLPLLEDVLPGVLHHHERWDGRGYPRGLKEGDIPPLARIIALADTFDAMSSTRSYRAAMPRAAVLAEIRKCAAVQFDPALAQLFVSLDFSAYDRMVAVHAIDSAAKAAA